MDDWNRRFLLVSNGTRAQMVSFVRLFSVYLNSIGISSYVPGKVPSAQTTVPHIMSRNEIHSFFAAVDAYAPCVPRPAFHRLAGEYRVIFRLIYCCGLRISEACGLRSDCVDLKNGAITVKHSKGDKDRIVYLANDLKEVLKEYWDQICLKLATIPEWFFPSIDPQAHMPKTSLDKKFSVFWAKTPYASFCDKNPTVHCLRHTFVVETMNTWMSSDADLNVMMPYLSKYLGHKGRNETFYYYHQVKDAFRIIKEKDAVSGRVLPEADAYES
ncbi:MAG: tyrosine-type recombinase/integrase, partial [Clostridiales bacterium]|nr:tyrosine-type recombinase/integrase [Clostridiales bacterium]